MKFWTSEYTLPHPWETVVEAAQRKYPNPMNTSVVGVDVIDRQITSAGNLRSHRLLSTDWPLPNWVTKLVGADRCYVSEHSEINPKSRTMSLHSRNLCCNNFLNVEEHLVYSPHPEDSSKTVFKSDSTITVSSVPMTDYLENVVIGTMSGKVNQGKQAMEWVIGKLKEESQDLSRAMQAQEEQFRDSFKHFSESAAKAASAASNSSL